MPTKRFLIFVGLVVSCLSVNLVKGDADILAEPINITIHAPDEVAVGESFDISIGVQVIASLTLNNLSVEIRDTDRNIMHAETLFINLALPIYQPPIEKNVTISITTEGEYSIFAYYSYTLGGTTYDTNILFATLGNVRLFSYRDLKSEYDSLTINYNDLNSSYNSLADSYSNLNDDYVILQKSYDSTLDLKILYEQLFITFTITTVVFIATTAFLALRKRKAKVNVSKENVNRPLTTMHLK